MITLSGNRISAVLLAAAVLFAAQPSAAAKIKLSNGAVFDGDIVSQNDNFIVLKVNGTNLSIAKKMVTEITGLPAGTVINNAGTPSAGQATPPAAQMNQPAVAQSAPAQPAPAAAPSPAAAQQPAQPATTQQPGPASYQGDVSPGTTVEIILKSGSRFKGTVISSNERLYVLEMAGGARVNVFKNVIAEVHNLSAPQTSGARAPAPAAVSAPVTPAPAPVQATTQPAPEKKPVVQTSPVAPVPAAAAPIPPAPVAPAAAPAAVQPAPEKKPVIQPAPAAPVVQAPPVITPRKRPDGKSELLLKTGTVFIGTIVSENDRFLTFSTSDGATINILRRLIKQIDGVPYVIKPGAVQTPSDTSAQLARTGRPAPAAAPQAGPQHAAASPEPAPHKMPRVELKPGISAAELGDSLKSNSAMVRSAAARQLGAMGQWAAGSVGPLAAMLGDTAGASDLPPLESDSAAIQKLLAPGLEAGRALARMGEQAYDELRRSAQSAGILTRQRALFGLGETQNSSFMPLLEQGLKDGEPHVRAVAAYGLRFRDAVNDLTAALNDRDGDVRTYAAATLAELHDSRSTGALVAALKDVRPSVRMFAATGLGKLRTHEAVAPLIAALADMSPEVRARAALALGSIADTAAVNPLCVALTEKIAPVRVAAAVALGEIRDPRAIPSLYSALEESSDTVRTAIETSLRLHTEIPLLIGVLDNENSQVRENAAYILWLMSGKDLGQDKQAWIDWYAKEQAGGTKPPEPDKQQEKDKGKKKK